MTTSAPIHIFVLIDALGWALVEDRDFLADLLPHRRPLRTILGYSSGAIPTILTGRPPVEHGHWNLFYYDPARSPFAWLRRLAFLPDRVLNHRVTRRILKEVIPMLSWSLSFLVVAIIAGLLGFWGVAGLAGDIAKVLFFLFLVLFVVSLIFGRRRPVV